ncbi:haloacid dehalogenase-like hydrolase [Oribacterium sp. KHPX15]|uniref:haloacid dehalogenase-like hydrolase n=1 Tax=Oribacterium sp. KHPX15 TaxID=1855342 RepID=UPI000894E39D|nr:HAD family hydrolase [Oribacterium sp. KHPX15]SEA61734.1 haloacid dehalogenase-like hydrolase [Oribacterium sp. KHPX15]
MERENSTSIVWKYIAIVLIAVTIALTVAMVTLINSKLKSRTVAEETPANTIEETMAEVVETIGETVPETEAPVELSAAEMAVETGNNMLTYWTDSALTKQQLISYMSDITEESSPNFIPVDRRIAVFDFDGTLFCETDPNYFWYNLLVYRVFEDDCYRAKKFEKATAQKIVDLNEKGKKANNLPMDIAKSIASSFAGMTLEEFDTYIQNYKQLPMPSYNGLLRGDAWYLPMLQIVEYLQANDFTVYVVSGSDRFIVRSIVKNSPLNVPMRQIIGTDESVVATGQEDEDGLSYTFTGKDKIVLGGQFLRGNVNMNKTTAIIQEIGVQPVLSFGNTMSDASMAMYTITENPYKSLAFMLCCDDLDRENGNLDKANAMYQSCAENNWIPVSMKNDWTTIYGDSVTKKVGVDEALAPAA